MDSANSDSSSCGEDQEYDSRAAAAAYSFPSFVNHHHPVPPPPPPSPPPFDPFSNLFQPQNPSPSNPNIFWQRNAYPRSDPYPNNSIINFPFTVRPQPTTAVAPPANQNQNPAARNTKKRSRASRRAPTTVLTTDTSNFRAMVQEFTGIPAPPFQRTGLDLYGAPSIMRLKPHDDGGPQPPPYLHRPFAPPQPFLTSIRNSNLFDANLKFPFSSSIHEARIQGSYEIPPNHGMHSNIKTVAFGCGSATVGNLPNLVSSNQIRPGNDHTGYDNDHVRAQTRTLNFDGMSYLHNPSRDFLHGEKGRENGGLI